MAKLKDWGQASARLLAPVGTGLGALLTVIGGLQSLTGFNPVGGEKLLLVGLVVFAVCGAVIILMIDQKVRESDEWIGNEHKRALLRDGIPAMRGEYFSRVREGDYAIVARFWLGGIVNVTDTGGKGDLHFACEGGHAAIVQGILERGGDPRRPDNAGFTPLMFAAMYGRTKAAEKLFDHDCALNGRTADGCSPLYLAAVFGRSQMVEMLIKQGAQIDSIDHDGMTPLMAALVEQKWETAEKLLDAGWSAPPRVDR